MIRAHHALAALLPSLLATGSCGNEEGPPPAPGAVGAWVEISLQAGGQLVRLPATVAGVTVETASFQVRELRLVADHGSDDDRLRIRDQVLDLGQGTAVFRLPEAPPGLYSRLRMRIDRAEEEEESQAATVVIAGKTSDGAAFALRENEGVELDLRAGDGVELIPGMALTAGVRLNLDGWFSGVSLAPGGDRGGERLRDNIEASATLTLRNGPPGSPGVAQ